MEADTEYDVVAIKQGLEAAKHWGLEIELIFSAINIAKANPDYDTPTIIGMALDDWDI
tara:strand:- start:137 stop:310 length:174 start_codon:yes stop_codon:yes gene_type:complete